MMRTIAPMSERIEYLLGTSACAKAEAVPVAVRPQVVTRPVANSAKTLGFLLTLADVDVTH